MPTVAIIGGEENATNVDLVRAWERYGHDCVLVSAAEALGRLGAGDMAVARLDVRRTLDGVEPGLVELMGLAARGVHVVNRTRALVNAHDKLRTARVLAAAGLPHVPTWHVRPGEPLPIAPPLVVKPRFGSWGADVYRCDDRADGDRLLAAISSRPWFRRHGAIVQPLVPPAGSDLRLVVAGGSVVGGEARVAAGGEWRTNISLGGSHRRARPGTWEQLLARRAAAALGMDFAGVDLIPVAGRHLVLEVNAAVDFDQSYARPGSDVFLDVAAALQLPLAARVGAVHAF